MEASTSNDPDVKTFRGRSLEEILPQIREELGPDAIVLRRREGLTGGVGGFFQRPYVEVDARGPMGGEQALEIRSDRAADNLTSISGHFCGRNTSWLTMPYGTRGVATKSIRFRHNVGE